MESSATTFSNIIRQGNRLAISLEKEVEMFGCFLIVADFKSFETEEPTPIMRIVPDLTFFDRCGYVPNTPQQIIEHPIVND